MPFPKLPDRSKIPPHRATGSAFRARIALFAFASSMDTRLAFEILPQPDSESCGPTCLQAVYRYFGDEMPLEQVIAECIRLEEGGTLAVLLGCHALRRGYDATIYTYNLQVFDPTWFHPERQPLSEKL
jgi:hypothetical protein